MHTTKLLYVMAIGLSAAACTSTYSTTTTQAAAGPGPIVRTASEQACIDYGFSAGTVGFDRCVTREREARLRGRVIATYSDAQLAADSREACYSYGIQPGTPGFDRCVGREIDARHYRASVAVDTPAPGYTSVTTYSERNPAPYYTQPAQPEPAAGVPAFKDEYNFRYDGQGNRLDRNGNIISPQSTQP
jgi:hypothetical protein